MRPSPHTPPRNAPTRILIVDDREADARELSNTMVSRGYDLEVAHSSFKALDIAKRWKPQVAILDVNMPGMDGLVLSQRLREYADDPIVIFVTSDDSNEMRRLCLESGDDYITKPYDGENLLLRVKNKLRRFAPNTSGAPDEEETAHQAHKADRTKTRLEDNFTPTETRLLNALIAGGGETVSRDELLADVWGASDYVNDNTLDRNIRRLREKIEPDPQHPQIILTVRRVGYRLDPAEWRRRAR